MTDSHQEDVRATSERAKRFPRPPRGQRHLFVVCRYDGPREDMTQAFILTRGYWSEDEANNKAGEQNDAEGSGDSTYFVLPARVADSG